MGPAPFQYRAAPLFFAGFFYAHLHWPFRYGLTLEDCLASFAAVLGGYELLLTRPLLRKATPTTLALASAAYAAAALYLFAWQDFYKKSETDIAAALTVLLLTAWSPFARKPNALLRSLAIILIAAALATVRADIALCMSLGVLAIAFFRGENEFALARRPALLVAALSMVVAAGVQALLMKVVFPHAGPYESAVFMLPHDIGNPAHVMVCLAYVLPTFWALKTAWTQRFTGDTAGFGFALGSVPFFVLWALVGRLEEVRIFLPVGLAAAPLAAQMVTVLVTDSGNEPVL